MRTRLGRSARKSPLTSATNSSVEMSERKPTIRKSPVSVGNRAEATRSTVCPLSLERINLSFIILCFLCLLWLKRLQVLNEICLLLLSQIRVEEAVVMLDHVAQRRETPVVIETTLFMCPEPFQRRRAITFIRRTFRLEIVDADLFRLVHIPTGLTKHRRHVTLRALRLAIEERRATCRGRCVETSRRRSRCRDCELIKMKRRKFCRDQIRIAAHVAETRACSDRKLHRIVESRIAERSLPVHLEVRDERVPVRD